MEQVIREKHRSARENSDRRNKEIGKVPEPVKQATDVTDPLKQAVRWAFYPRFFLAHVYCDALEFELAWVFLTRPFSVHGRLASYIVFTDLEEGLFINLTKLNEAGFVRDDLFVDKEIRVKCDLARRLVIQNYWLSIDSTILIVLVAIKRVLIRIN